MFFNMCHQVHFGHCKSKNCSILTYCGKEWVVIYILLDLDKRLGIYFIFRLGQGFQYNFFLTGKHLLLLMKKQGPAFSAIGIKCINDI